MKHKTKLLLLILVVAVACLAVCGIALKKIDRMSGNLKGSDAAINFSVGQTTVDEQERESENTQEATNTSKTIEIVDQNASESENESTPAQEVQTPAQQTSTEQTSVQEKKPLTEQGLILDQKEYGDVDFGAFGNVADNGCGAVAIYNILKLDQKNVELTSIINELGAAKILWGVAGTAPTGITKYLKNKGYETKIVANKNNFESTLKKYKYGIYCYWTVTGGHFEVIYDYNNNDGTWQILNPTYRSSMGDLNSKYKWYVKFLICVK